MTIPGMNFNYDFSAIDWSSPNGTTNPIASKQPVFPANPQTAEKGNAPANTPKADPKKVMKNTVKYAKELIDATTGLNNSQKALLKELLNEYITESTPRLCENDFNAIQKMVRNYVNDPEFKMSDKQIEKLQEIASKTLYIESKPVAEAKEEAEEKLEEQEHEQAIAALKPEYDRQDIMDMVEITAMSSDGITACGEKYSTDSTNIADTNLFTDIVWDGNEELTAKNNGKTLVDNFFNELYEQTLESLGEEKCTPEIKKMLNKAKIHARETIKSKWLKTHKYAGTFDHGAQASFDVSIAANAFFNKFDELTEKAVNDYKKANNLEQENQTAVTQGTQQGNKNVNICYANPNYDEFLEQKLSPCGKYRQA